MFAAAWAAYGESFLDDLGESATAENTATAEGDLWGDQIHVKINSVTKSTVLDDDLPPGIVVSYTFGNNSTMAVSPVRALDFNAYQDGHELESAYFFSEPVEGCESSKKNTACSIDLSDFYKVQPNSSKKLLEGFG